MDYNNTNTNTPTSSSLTNDNGAMSYKPKSNDDIESHQQNNGTLSTIQKQNNSTQDKVHKHYVKFNYHPDWTHLIHPNSRSLFQIFHPTRLIHVNKRTNETHQFLSRANRKQVIQDPHIIKSVQPGKPIHWYFWSWKPTTFAWFVGCNVNQLIHTVANC